MSGQTSTNSSNSTNSTNRKTAWPLRLWYWLFNQGALYENLSEQEKQRLDYFRLAMFVLLHLACLAVFYVGISWLALLTALLLYLSRMFFITAFYHRYFSHRSYSVSRPVQLLMAIAACTAAQRGPLWWASHHRAHHASSDTARDPHSPRNGFLNSHLFWFFRCRNFPIQEHRIKDLLRFRELKLLERINWLPFLLLLFFCYALGALLASHFPDANTSGLQLVVWGGLVSTVLLYHATYSINSLAHVYGTRRFNTRDNSRNNRWLALLTLGEGWHNNHHRYPASARQGFYRDEWDLSYAVLTVFASFGWIENLRAVPDAVLEEGRAR